MLFSTIWHSEQESEVNSIITTEDPRYLVSSKVPPKIVVRLNGGAVEDELAGALPRAESCDGIRSADAAISANISPAISSSRPTRILRLPPPVRADLPPDRVLRGLPRGSAHGSPRRQRMRKRPPRTATAAITPMT